MWIVLRRADTAVGTRDFYDSETMSPRYSRRSRPTWHEQDNGDLKANFADHVAEALCEKYSHITPVVADGNGETDDDSDDADANATDGEGPASTDE